MPEKMEVLFVDDEYAQNGTRLGNLLGRDGIIQGIRTTGNTSLILPNSKGGNLDFGNNENASEIVFIPETEISGAIEYINRNSQKLLGVITDIRLMSGIGTRNAVLKILDACRNQSVPSYMATAFDSEKDRRISEESGVGLFCPANYWGKDGRVGKLDALAPLIGQILTGNDERRKDFLRKYLL